MSFNFLIFVCLLKFSFILCFNNTELPTLYQFYTAGGIREGLKAEGKSFQLNGKNLTIIGGEFHYFRVVPERWEHVLRKIKAAGLNTVQIYVPWNLHEERPGQFNFEGSLDLPKLLELIRSLDLFTIIRPGPFICAEWEFGGLPGWLLSDPNMKVRSDYKPFLDAADNFYKTLVPVFKSHQFVFNGSIIAVQIEDEFASYGSSHQKEDLNYLLAIKNQLIKYGTKELLFTSDVELAKNKDNGSLPDVLITVNFGSGVQEELDQLNKLQPNRPKYVAEYWDGWYDFWGAGHNMKSAKVMDGDLRKILLENNASVCLYMFHGGTNFGFTNGANKVMTQVMPITTSYDYDAPLNEAGDYTVKYWKVNAIVNQMRKENRIPNTKTIPFPSEFAKANYGIVNISYYLPLDQMLMKIKPIQSKNPVTMEMINLTTNYGQNFGFILYRKTTAKRFKSFKLDEAADRTMILLDNKTIQTFEITRSPKNLCTNLTEADFNPKVSKHDLDIIVENIGRVNHGKSLNDQRKGIRGNVYLDEQLQQNWTIYPIEFSDNFIKSFKNSNWKRFQTHSSPALFKAILNIKETPKDTFLKMLSPWRKGIVFVNNFNIGRYWPEFGPQKTLYVPAPLLKKGRNEILIFELHQSDGSIEFVDKPILA